MFIQIKQGNEQPRIYRINDVLHNFNALNQETTIRELPFNTSIIKIKRSDAHRLLVYYNVVFGERYLHISENIQEYLRHYGFSQFLEHPDKINVYENEGLTFFAEIKDSDNRPRTERIFFYFDRFKILPNIYHEKRLCFGTTNFSDLQNSPETIMNDIPYYIQTFFASTFNTDLQSTMHIVDRSNLKRKVLEILESVRNQENNQRISQAIRIYEDMGADTFSNTYVYLMLSSITKLSLSTIQEMMNEVS